jgi:hypothetical protein
LRIQASRTVRQRRSGLVQDVCVLARRGGQLRGRREDGAGVRDESDEGSFFAQPGVRMTNAKLKTGRIPTVDRDRNGAPPPDDMPIEHIVDQHAYPGVGHYMTGTRTFAEKFAALFDPYDGVTGVNTRRLSSTYRKWMRDDRRSFEELPAVRTCRPAQVAVTRIMHGKFLGYPMPVGVQPKTMRLPVWIPSGTLAGAVGPIEGSVFCVPSIRSRLQSPQEGR